MNPDNLTRRMATPDDWEIPFSIGKQAMRSYAEANLGPWDEDEQREMFFPFTDPRTHELFSLEGERSDSGG